MTYLSSGFSTAIWAKLNCSDDVQERGAVYAVVCLWRCCARKGDCVRVGVSVTMLYKQRGLCTCWCVCSNVVQETGAVYMFVCL